MSSNLNLEEYCNSHSIAVENVEKHIYNFRNKFAKINNIVTETPIYDDISAKKRKLQDLNNENNKKRRIPCPIVGCPLSFDANNHLLQHLFVHTGEKFYACPVPNCKFAGSRKSAVREHAKSIHPTISNIEVISLAGPKFDSDGMFICPEPGCGMKYKDIMDYRVHLAGHRCIYKCTYPKCNYGALKKSLIKAHMSIHNGKKYICTYEGCDYEGNTQVSLNRHAKIHCRDEDDLKLTLSSEDNKYHCFFNGCKYSTIRRSNLKRHILNHSDKPVTKQQSYQCDFPDCHFSTLSLSLYKSHMAEFHQNINIDHIDSDSVDKCEKMSFNDININKNVETYKEDYV